MLKSNLYCKHVPSLTTIAGAHALALKVRSMALQPNVRNSACSPHTLVRSINNRDYQISHWWANILFLKLRRESKAIAMALVGCTCSVDFSLPAVSPSILKIHCTKLPWCTSGCMIHFHAVKRIIPLRADCMVFYS